VIVPRNVGAAEWGEWTIAGLVCGIAGSLAGLGLATLVTKEVARDGDAAETYLEAPIVAHRVMIVPMVLMIVSFHC
jgi:O-antigen/teichoic acid export membrane protein